MNADSTRAPTEATSTLERTLDRLHAAARAQPGLQRLAIISRILLALAFIPTGMVKVLGHRFTTMPVETTVGFFFEAMYRTGGYWNFIGLAQVTAGLLLLVPRTASLGAVLYFPIILNIHLITVSLGFQGTPVVTGLMLLASTFLLCWEYHRWKGLLWSTPASALPGPVPLDHLELSGYVLGTVAGLGVFGSTRSLIPGATLPGWMLLGVLAVVLVVTGWTRLALRARRADRAGHTAVANSPAPIASGMKG